MTWQTHMTKILSWAGAFVCLSGAPCRAQNNCAESMKQTTYPCVYRSCSSHITVNTPEGERALFVACEPVECCQQLFTDCYFDGNACSQARDPLVRERVAQVAATSRVLVADCGGRYVLYDPRPGRGRGGDSVLVNEHILR
jgi:hypothetical protein